jgi:hypothetical protein
MKPAVLPSLFRGMAVRGRVVVSSPPGLAPVSVRPHAWCMKRAGWVGTSPPPQRCGDGRQGLSKEGVPSVVRDNLTPLLAEASEVGRDLPWYVERDFARYLECGVWRTASRGCAP